MGAFAQYRSLYVVDPLCPFNFCNVSEGLAKNRPDVKVQERRWVTFSLKIGSTLLRVRKEIFLKELFEEAAGMKFPGKGVEPGQENVS